MRQYHEAVRYIQLKKGRVHSDGKFRKKEYRAKAAASLKTGAIVTAHGVRNNGVRNTGSYVSK